MKLNKVFNFLDLVEYNELQKELIEWSKQQELKGKFPDILEDVNKYCNDTIITIAHIYSKDGLRAVWLTSIDSEHIVEERKEGRSPELGVEVRIAEEQTEPVEEEDLNFAFDYDFTGIYTDLNLENVVQSIKEYLEGTLENKNHL